LPEEGPVSKDGLLEAELTEPSERLRALGKSLAIVAEELATVEGAVPSDGSAGGRAMPESALEDDAAVTIAPVVPAAVDATCATVALTGATMVLTGAMTVPSACEAAFLTGAVAMSTLRVTTETAVLPAGVACLTV
jgi:hypothetical protein